MNTYHIYIKEEIINGTSRILIEYDVFYSIQKYITLGPKSDRLECNYYNIPGFVSKECAEEIYERFNSEKITDFVEAIKFIREIAGPYIIMNKLIE